MQKIMDYVTWGFIGLFAIPTVLIMASWNSLPGEPMYGVKRSFEQILLFFVKPSFAAEASLNVQFTERRFNEAKTLMANDQSNEGLAYLTQQIRATKSVIDRAPNKEKQDEVAQKYIATLRTVSAQLETQRRSPSGQVGQPTRAALPPSGSVGTPKPTAAPNSPPPAGDDIDSVQEEIKKTIIDLESLKAQNLRQLRNGGDDTNVDKQVIQNALEEKLQDKGLDMDALRKARQLNRND